MWLDLTNLVEDFFYFWVECCCCLSVYFFDIETQCCGAVQEL